MIANGRLGLDVVVDIVGDVTRRGRRILIETLGSRSVYFAIQRRQSGFARQRPDRNCKFRVMQRYESCRLLTMRCATREEKRSHDDTGRAGNSKSIHLALLGRGKLRSQYIRSRIKIPEQRGSHCSGLLA